MIYNFDTFVESMYIMFEQKKTEELCREKLWF